MNLKQLIEGRGENLDPVELGGPLRYLFWSLATQVVKEPKDWEKYMTTFTNDERFCEQTPARRREKRDRLTVALVRGTSQKDLPVKEVTWKRIVEGLVLLKAKQVTVELVCKRKLTIAEIEKSISISFNPTLSYINQARNDDDRNPGVSSRLDGYLKNPVHAISEMKHPLGKLYWGLVDKFNAGPTWDKLMEQYLSNPDNCEQIRNYRNDKYSNIKRDVCNTEGLSWMRFCQAVKALNIHEMTLNITTTTESDETFDASLTIDMEELEFIKVKRDGQ